MIHIELSHRLTLSNQGRWNKLNLVTNQVMWIKVSIQVLDLSGMGDVIIHPYISDGKPVIVAFAQTHIVELNILL